jgi:hypothetical protein
MASSPKIADAAEPMQAAIGASIHKYSKVEVAQLRILEAILKIETLPAALIFFSIQNVRTRNELIEELLRHYCGEGLVPFWGRCSKFLAKLSLFRNAIVHWIQVIPSTLIPRSRE